MSTAAPSGARQGGSPRSAARLAAVQALFQIEQSKTTPEAVLEEFLCFRLDREPGYGEVDRSLFGDLVRGASDRRADVDDMLAATLVEDWPLPRLDATLRAILRVGTYELLARADVPARVVLNEYIDLAHAFFGGKEPGLVNGVRHRLASRLREDEMTA